MFVVTRELVEFLYELGCMLSFIKRPMRWTKREIPMFLKEVV